MNDNVEEIVRPYEPLEPQALKVDGVPIEDSLYSLAISMKRIADTLEKQSVSMNNMLFNSIGELIIAVKEQ